MRRKLPIVPVFTWILPLQLNLLGLMMPSPDGRGDWEELSAPYRGRIEVNHRAGKLGSYGVSAWFKHALERALSYGR